MTDRRQEFTLRTIGNVSLLCGSPSFLNHKTQTLIDLLELALSHFRVFHHTESNPPSLT